MRYCVLILCSLMVTGCETFERVSFGLDVADAATQTTVSLRHGEGKTVVGAEQDGQRVSAYFRR